MRECHRALRSGGRMAALVIETGPDLDPDDLALAAELGPSDVRSAFLLNSSKIVLSWSFMAAASLR